MWSGEQGFYALEPRDLFEKIRAEMVAFASSNSPLDLLNVILWLRHLSEWIRCDSEAGARLANDLHGTDEFTVIRGICNRGKHFRINREPNPGTEIARGGRLGLLSVGDGLGQDHYLAEGHDIRHAINFVYRTYLGYFEPERGADVAE